jgi:hypothetical protein
MNSGAKVFDVFGFGWLAFAEFDRFLTRDVPSLGEAPSVEKEEFRECEGGRSYCIGELKVTDFGLPVAGRGGV